MKSLAASLALSVFALAGAPLAAQDVADAGAQPVSDDVHMSIVYGDDPAPPCPQGEICVVAHLPESERFRIPETLRFSDDPANTAWTRRVEQLDMLGDFGAFSCSPAGAGGFTGCTQQLIKQAYGEKATSSNVRFSDLIAAAREERLSKIDEQAAAEQERVEAIEKEYMDRLEAERDAKLPDEQKPAIVPNEDAGKVADSPDGGDSPEG